MFPNFVPLEFRGMSILTALTFFFVMMGFTYFHATLKREFKRIHIECDKHDNRLEQNRNDIAEMKTNIALTLQTVTRMERILDKQQEE